MARSLQQVVAGKLGRIASWRKAGYEFLAKMLSSALRIVRVLVYPGQVQHASLVECKVTLSCRSLFDDS